MAERLTAMRLALQLLETSGSRFSMVAKIQKDVSKMKSTCATVWESISDPNDEDSGDELTHVSRGYSVGRSDMARYRSVVDSGQTGGRRPKYKYALANIEENNDGGRTLAGSLGPTVASWIPLLVVGTHSVYSVVVPAGMKSLIPQYTLVGGQMVIDHYNVYTSPSSIMGWAPQPLAAVSLWSIPVVASVFTVTHLMDSIHSYVYNYCSLKAAVTNVLTGTLSGLAFGTVYYGLISYLGIASSPFVSLGLCSVWLIGCYYKRKPHESFADLVIAGTGNLGATVALLLSGGSFWMSCAVGIVSSILGSQMYSWASTLWRKNLEEKLVLAARELLQVDENATAEQINSAFRKLAKQWHPDKTGGERDAFELAYLSREILLTDLSRKEHANSKIGFISGIFAKMTSAIIPFQQQVEPIPNRSRPPRAISDEYLQLPD